MRFARTLAEAGWEVTLAGLAADGLPARDAIPVRPHGPDGERRIPLVRVEPGGRLAPFLHERRGRVERMLRRVHVATPSALMQVAAWPLAARAWGHALRRLPPADLYHACGLGGAFAARQLARGAQADGRAGRVVYDMIDIFLEANRYPFLPGWRRSLFRRREAAVVAAVDATTTVNDAIADDAIGRWRLRERPLVVWNAPARSEIPDGDRDLIRAAAGIPADRRIVAFLGRFIPGRGILEAGDAALRVADTAFVAIGYGPLEPDLRARDADRVGRHYTLPAVPPEDVAEWAASADATVMVSPAATPNIRLSSPNKLFESLAGGAPIVYERDMLGMRAVLEPSDLGLPARHDDPDDIARAMAALVHESEPGRSERRTRARQLIRERYAWDVHAPAYLALVDRLVPGRG